MRTTDGVGEQHGFWTQLARYRTRYLSVGELLDQRQRSEAAQKQLRDELQRLRLGLSVSDDFVISSF